MSLMKKKKKKKKDSIKEAPIIKPRRKSSISII